MAPHEEEDDPAVYRSGSSKKKNGANGTNGTNGHAEHEDEAMHDEEEDEVR